MKKILCVFVAVILMMQMFAMFGTVSALNEPVIKVASVSGTAGSNVTVAVSIENNPGLGGLEAALAFDKTALEYVSGECLLPIPEGMEFDCLSTVAGSNAAGSVTLAYLDFTLAGVSGDVVIYKLTFNIKDGTPAGDLDLNLTVSDSSFVYGESGLEDLNATASSGKITVTEGLRGDVNKDGEVNSDDLTALARHVGGIEEITDAVGLANGDTNGDTSVNSDDLTQLARHVGGIETFPEVG